MVGLKRLFLHESSRHDKSLFATNEPIQKFYVNSYRNSTPIHKLEKGNIKAVFKNSRSVCTSTSKSPRRCRTSTKSKRSLSQNLESNNCYSKNSYRFLTKRFIRNPRFGISYKSEFRRNDKISFSDAKDNSKTFIPKNGLNPAYFRRYKHSINPQASFKNKARRHTNLSSSGATRLCGHFKEEARNFFWRLFFHS